MTLVRGKKVIRTLTAEEFWHLFDTFEASVIDPNYFEKKVIVFFKRHPSRFYTISQVLDVLDLQKRMMPPLRRMVISLWEKGILTRIGGTAPGDTYRYRYRPPTSA